MSYLKKKINRGWELLRAISGDDAYERYLEHWHTHHAEEEGEPLDCKAFFQMEQDRKWNGIKRCC